MSVRLKFLLALVVGVIFFWGPSLFQKAPKQVNLWAAESPNAKSGAQKKGVVAKSKTNLPEGLQAIEIGPGFSSQALGDYCQYTFAQPHTPVVDIVAQAGSQSWQNPGFAGLNFGWTQKAVIIRCAINNTSAQARPLLLQFHWSVCNIWETYYLGPNGQPTTILSGDNIPYDQRPSPKGRTFLAPIKAGAKQITVIYMRFVSNHPISVPLFLRTKDAWNDLRHTEAIVIYSVIGAMVVMLFLNILLYIGMRDHRFVYYIGFLFTFIIFALSLFGIGQMYIWGNYPVLGKMVWALSAGLFTFFLAQFGRSWFPGLPKYGIYIINFVSYVGLGAAILEFFVDYYPAYIAALNGIFALVVITPVIGTAVFIQRAPQGLIWISSVGLFFCFLAVFLFLVIGLLPPLFMIHYSIGIGAVFCSLILTLAIPSQVNQMRREMEVMNQRLSSSYDEIAALHEKQKGDYMLTSYLLQPLQKLSPPSQAVVSDFYVRQFKQFSFRNRDSEIGGDLCLTEQIKLGHKHFTFFVNGDAMGKSIQGAGGALILGAAIQAQLAQARLGKSYSDLPDIWLRNIWRDIHELFLTFDGAMLMSMVMGLVDEESGVMYFCNSEHPWTVLYRDGSASFIESELTMRKLGTPLEGNEFYLQIFRLIHGDMIICGSDGRDDIVLNGTQDSESINEDETLFLRWVEQGQGWPAKIAQAILAGSQQKDDLSLLTLQYLGRPFQPQVPTYVREVVTPQELQTIEGKTSLEAVNRVLKNLAKKSMTAQNWSRARALCQYLYHNDPTDQTNIKMLITALYKMHALERSADFGELLVLRDPARIEYLYNQAVIYKRLGIGPKAQHYARRVLKIDPDHTKAQVIAGGPGL